MEMLRQPLVLTASMRSFRSLSCDFSSLFIPKGSGDQPKVKGSVLAALNMYNLGPIDRSGGAWAESVDLTGFVATYNEFSFFKAMVEPIFGRSILPMKLLNGFIPLSPPLFLLLASSLPLLPPLLPTLNSMTPFSTIVDNLVFSVLFDPFADDALHADIEPEILALAVTA
ncbi:hypothetical protein B0H66DRAFT_639722 [Apodospora peruviana]|uniref:Uncharacterized protein n=1 Tax=Apodospora peruviana TaxID=516989 RepID=A0AAE0M3X8_9PEZI|nr:hypothetical protein B0H66DRAFT_639722 [Apodospora peruviana]